MTLREAQTAASDLSFVGSHLGECFYVTPSNAPEGLSFMVANGTIARVDVDSSTYASVSGARVGQTEAEVLKLYGGALEIVEHKYDDDGHYLIYAPSDAAEQNYRMIFETDGKKVTTFRAGRLPEVAYIEHCL